MVSFIFSNRSLFRLWNALFIADSASGEEDDRCLVGPRSLSRAQGNIVAVDDVGECSAGLPMSP